MFTKSLPLLLIVFVFSVIDCSQAMANTVSGKYTSTANGNISLTLHVSQPAPQNIILEQYLPPGTRVVRSSPRARKVNSNSGVAKWLFKRVTPGQIQINMTVEPKGSSKAVNGILRYRLPDGSMAQTRIAR